MPLLPTYAYRRDRPIYAGPRPKWKDRTWFIINLVLTPLAILTATLNFLMHRPFTASFWLVWALLNVWVAYRSYRRRP